MATHNTNGADNSGDKPMRRRHQRQQHQQGRPSQRHLSANHIEFNDLRSRHRELTQKVGSLRTENRRLKSRRVVTDDALSGFGSDSPRRALAQINRNHAKDLEFYNEQLNENERLISDAENQLHEKVEV
jgi:hypothetical protein